MRIEQEATVTRPISVDDQFFSGLEPILDEVQQAAFRVAAARYSLPLEKVKTLVAEAESGPSLPSPSPSDADYFERALERHTAESVVDLVRRLSETSFDVRYETGFNFSTESVSQLKEVLSTEPGRPKSLWIGRGRRYDGLHLHLWLSSTATATADLKVIGERRDVEYITRRLRDLLIASEPEHPWLHSAWPARLLTFAFAGSFAAIFLVLLDRYSAQLGEDMVTALAGWFFAILFAGALVGTIPAKAARAAFPRCEFQYGPDKRRRAARRSLIWALVSLILVPTVLALALT